MSDPPPKLGTPMPPEAIDDLLSGMGHGVLSMASANRGYGLPIFYWYDPDTSQVILRFLAVPDSKKAQVLSESESVTLTVYEITDVDEWQSVVLTGNLAPIENPEVPEEFSTLFFLRESENPGSVETYSSRQYDATWYELEIQDTSGRYSGPGTLE